MFGKIQGEYSDLVNRSFGDIILKGVIEGIELITTW